MAKVILYEGPMNKMLKAPEGDVGKHLTKKGRMIEVAAKGQVGVRTGALRSSIHMRYFVSARGMYIKVGSKKNYALAHHEGTKPHMIYPNRAQSLKFVSRGSVVFVRAVRHPGTKANKYLTDNLKLIT
jgi:hypothetical protein